MAKVLHHYQYHFDTLTGTAEETMMSFLELSAVLGNVGEFLGSIAVLVTLIYLAVQVRHSRELLEREYIKKLEPELNKQGLPRSGSGW